MSQRPDDPPMPDLGSAYEVVEIIGEGGMGTVYLANDLRHGRQVAVKTIRREFVTPDVSRRFEREIRVTSRLQHPRILPLLDSGTADGALFYVMQYVEGESLESRLAREGQLPIDEALRIARHVADALAYAHEQDVVHRDIKPANIMLSGGHAFVMDFGIARAVAEGGSSLTSTGAAIGTPRYMSPEQIADATAVDGRSDIYALGCVLYEMVAGQPPFVGPSIDSILRQHLASEPPSLGVHRPGAPLGVETIVARSLQKSSADRYPNARELVAALRDLEGPGGAVDAPVRSPIRTAAIVVVGYVAGSWALLELVERVAQSADLPSWTVPFALILLLIGLLVTVATTFVQARLAVAGGTTTGSGSRRSDGSGRPRRLRLRSLFRWRNVVAGGVLALALWGVVAAVMIWARPTDGTALDERGPGTEVEARDPEGAPDDDAPEPEGRPEGEALAGVEGAEGDSARAGPVTAPPAAATAGPDATRDVRAAPDRARPTESTEDETARVATARSQARSARIEAEAAGARLVRSEGLALADSIWAVALDAESAGRADEATRMFDRARQAYDRTAGEARTVVVARLEAARTATDSVRSRATPEGESYADGERLRTRSRELEAEGDLPAALEMLNQARAAYERAVFVQLPPDYEAEPAESEVAERRPEERVASAMSALEAAFEAEDVAAIQRIWVNLAPAQVEQFRDFFENGRDMEYRYTVESGSIRSTELGVEFRVSIQWEYREERGDRLVQPPAFEQRYRIESRASGDVLVSL